MKTEYHIKKVRIFYLDFSGNIDDNSTQVKGMYVLFLKEIDQLQYLPITCRICLNVTSRDTRLKRTIIIECKERISDTD